MFDKADKMGRGTTWMHADSDPHESAFIRVLKRSGGFQRGGPLLMS